MHEQCTQIFSTGTCTISSCSHGLLACLKMRNIYMSIKLLKLTACKVALVSLLLVLWNIYLHSKTDHFHSNILNFQQLTSIILASFECMEENFNNKLLKATTVFFNLGCMLINHRQQNWASSPMRTHYTHKHIILIGCQCRLKAGKIVQTVKGWRLSKLTIW